MNFDDSFAALMGNEGMLSMDPRDPGNWTGRRVNMGVLKGTKYGISAASYPNLDIENLTLEDAKKIAYRDYWAAAGCEIAPEEIRFDLFDMAYNSGPMNAVKTLQMAVGAVVDGHIGSETIMRAQAANGHLAARFEGARILHLTAELSRDDWDSQGKGLMNRVAHNLLRA